MESKKIKGKFGKGNQEVDINCNKLLLDHILKTADKIGYSDKMLYEHAGISKQIIHYALNKSKSDALSKKPKEFVLKIGELIIQQNSPEWIFNVQLNIFERVITSSKKEFHDGIYYAYYETQSSTKIEHSIIYIDGTDIEMWSNTKKAKGKIYIDDTTFSAVLFDQDNELNTEFYIGPKTKNPAIKYFNASWRNSQGIICSVVCLAKYIKSPKYKSWSEFRQFRNAWREDVIKNQTNFVERFFKDTKYKFLHYNISDEYANEN